MRRCHGFTLLEVILAIAIGLLLLGLAVPSVAGLLAEQRLKETFERFDDFVRQAQKRSVSERRAFVMNWDQTGISLEPAEPVAEDRGQEWPRLDFGDDESIALERPAALAEKPPAQWPFWRSGTCEPAVVVFNGPAGGWTVRYDALTVRGTMIEQEVR